MGNTPKNRSKRQRAHSAASPAPETCSRRVCRTETTTPSSLPTTTPTTTTTTTTSSGSGSSRRCHQVENANNVGGDKTNNDNKRSQQEGERAGSATDALEDHFSAVEIFFQLTGERQRGDILFPRDVGNLLLWSVPLAVPLIEGPKVFFLKNKSRLRDVVVIYVNGWTHDDMLLAGAGSLSGGDTDPTTATPQNSDSKEEDVGEAPLNGTDRGAGHEGDVSTKTQSAPRWAERIGCAMLHPIRTQRCWARRGCGVQFAPMFVPDARSSLEREVFWRNDPPRAPRNGQRRNCTGSNDATPLEGETSASACGVGTLFGRALSIHSNGPPKTTSSDTAVDAADTTKDAPSLSLLPSLSSDMKATPTAVEAETKTVTTTPTPDTKSPSLWDDRETLLRYALSLEKDKELLRNLAFVVDMPSDSAELSQWTLFDAAPASDDNNPPRVFALDCEMVLLENRVSALARITLLDVRDGATVIDTLVNPGAKVVDYLTRYSGVSEEMLEGVKTTLEDCQRDLRRYINTDTFVVGHSLENDFKACKVLPNCYILDSAHLFPHPAGLPLKNALRFLAMRYLQKRIQQGAHDSAVDASISAELVYLKLVHGPSFGVRERVSVLELIEGAATTPTTTAVAEKEEDNKPKTSDETQSTLPASSSPTTTTTPLGIELNVFDDACVLRDIISAKSNGKSGGLLHAVPVRHDRDAVRKAVRCLQQRRDDKKHAAEGAPLSYAMTWVQLTETVVRRGADDGGDDKDEKRPWEELQLERVDETNRRVMEIIRAAPHNSLVLVLAAGASPVTPSLVSSGPSRGVCFAFVKDEMSPGPSSAWIDATTTAEEESDGKLKTPPACQQQ